MSTIKTNRLAPIASLLFAFGFTPAAFALDFSSWSTSGDVQVSSPNTNSVSLSNNALSGDDAAISQPDSNFNFSGTAAVNQATLEGDLGLNSGSLDPDSGNFIQATEGSGLGNTLSFSEPTTLSFNWQFLTNDSTFVDGNGFRFADYSFVSVNNTISTIASTDSTLNPSSSNYSREATGSFSRAFAPGTYDIDFGVVDVQNTNNSSAFIITDAQTVSVPFEPSANFGIFCLLGIFGLNRYRKKQQAK